MTIETCGYGMAWAGPCQEQKPCPDHAGTVCISCGDPATHECDQTGQLVCGAPLCDNCEHTIFPDGTNGGIGFNAQSPPDGMRPHTRKAAQKYAPWYARESQD